MAEGFSVARYDWPAFQGRKPFQHQKHTVRFAIGNRRCLILNDMGTGKTLAALWSADILMNAGKLRRALVIGPKSTMRSVWYNELRLNLPHRTVGIAHGRTREEVLRNPGYEFAVMNHDGVRYVEDEIIRQQFGLIVIDELTAFKSNSERTKCMKRIADAQRAHGGGVWGMTGELTPNAPEEAFWPCKIVVPENQYLPKYYGQFRDACMVQINEYKWIAKPEAAQIVAMCAQPAIRFTRDQCLDLPDTTYQVLETELTKDQQTAYEKMKKEAYLDMGSGDISAANAGVKLNKLLQISAGAVKNDVGDVVELGCDDRLEQLWTVFEETPQQKLVVFATYRATIAMLEREAAKKGYRAAAIHGDVSSNLRASHIERFQTGDLQILVLQPQSAAHGITLTAASTIVWFSLIPSNEYFQQGNARIVRAGQTRKTLILMMVSTAAERHVAKILQEKGDMSREVMRLFADHEL